MLLIASRHPDGGCGSATDTTKTYVYDLGDNRTDNGGAYTGNRITGFNNCTYTTDAGISSGLAAFDPSAGASR